MGQSKLNRYLIGFYIGMTLEYLIRVEVNIIPIILLIV